jgi:hypothetical protein
VRPLHLGCRGPACNISIAYAVNGGEAGEIATSGRTRRIKASRIRGFSHRWVFADNTEGGDLEQPRRLSVEASRLGVEHDRLESRAAPRRRL